MRKLLASPVNMALTAAENTIYQNALKYIADISLNLMATKVKDRPEDFLSWCRELNRLCKEDLNQDLLDESQVSSFKKLQEILESAISIGQLKLLLITPWPIYASFCQEHAQATALDERLRLLAYSQNILTQIETGVIEEDKLVLAGKHTAKHDPSIYDFDVEWFGSCKGQKLFVQLLQQQTEQFAEALNEIPAAGEVTYPQYQAFCDKYKQIFITNGEAAATLYPATRLLALKRPDVFVALSSQKVDAICQGLSIAKVKKSDFSAYWQDLIMTLQTCPWWKAAEPEDEFEKSLWQYRAILIDLFFYADLQSASKSNYIKLRDKPKRTSKTPSIGPKNKRSKDSVIIMVDRALAADDIPQFIRNNRDAIISQVMGGKNIDEVIGLMRSIFG
ncbi:hypothetical protein [Catenovulum sediminis]|uniref:Uncharacterized protein n=1 Tax=Catenovulum sediminis TaxID=1740262 RepID=A0ABV1RIM7_9ALTE|nr:hypothetical protein [Catenovulum sediminis]